MMFPGGACCCILSDAAGGPGVAVAWCGSNRRPAGLTSHALLMFKSSASLALLGLRST